MTKIQPGIAPFGARARRKLYELHWRWREICARLFPSEFANDWRAVRPYTMVSYSRLRSLYRAVEYVIERQVPGDVVECGSYRGGSAALMGLALKRLNSDRTIWIFDTFEGLPPPTPADPDFEIASSFTGACRGDLAEVRALFERLGLARRTNFIKGLFQDTLPRCGVGSIAVLHLDGDWYESTRCCLEYLYDRVSPGGVIQIDDYGHWAGARKAVDEFLGNRGLPQKLRYLDYSGRQLRKAPLRS